MIDKKTKYDYGIALLKIMMSFVVVYNHFWVIDYTTNNNVIIKGMSSLSSLAVPVFVFTSFVLSFDRFDNNAVDVKKKFFRLYYPFIIWGTIYFFVGNILNIFLDNYSKGSFVDLFWQLFTGSCMVLNPAMWYQIVLIIIFFGFYAIYSCIGKKSFFCFMIFIIVLSFVLQYTNINYQIFCMTPYGIKYTFGRIVEIIPYAVAGYVFGYYRDFAYNNKCVFAFSLVGFFGSYCIKESVDGFGYSGLKIFIQTILFSIIIMTINYEKFAEPLKTIIKAISQYTFGVYCLQFMIGRVVNIIVDRMGHKIYRLYICVIIYVVCLVLSWLISRIPSRYAKALVV